MSFNHVMPQLVNTGGAVNAFSIGISATDSWLSSPNITSALDEIRSLSAVYAPIAANLTSNSVPITVSQLIGYYRSYTAGTSLFAGGLTTDYGMDAIAGAQVMSFTLSANPETYTQYHTTNNGSIYLSIPDYTAQRSPSDWVATLPGVGGTRLGSWQVTCAGTATFNTTFNPYSLPLASPIQIASKITAPYAFTVTVKDLYSGLTMTTPIAMSYANPTPASYTVQRIPKMVNTGSGWVSETTIGGTTLYT